MSRCGLVSVDVKVHLLKMEQLAVIKANRKSWKSLIEEIDTFIEEVECQVAKMDDVDEFYHDEMDMVETELISSENIRMEIKTNEKKRSEIMDRVVQFLMNFANGKKMQETLVKEWMDRRVKEKDFYALSVEEREKLLKKSKDGASVAKDLRTAFNDMKEEFDWTVKSLIEDHHNCFFRLIRILDKVARP